jgi:DNA adenine methylase
LASKIRALFPPHTRYCETHFGSGAVLLSSDGEGVAEYANDLDRFLSHFWWTMSDPRMFEDFRRRVASTPFSEPRFDEAKARIKKLDGVFGRAPQDSAVDFFVLNRQSRQALGKDFATPTSRLRRGMNEQVSAWLSAVDGLPEIHARLRRVEIRCMDAVKFIRELDSHDTLFYCDPPYLQETRAKGANEYGQYEMTVQQHAELLACLSGIKGKFLLSGYPSQLYDRAAYEFGWRHVDFIIDNKASSAKSKEKKIERLWMNYGASP